MSQRLFELGEGGQHRDQHLDVAEMRGAQDGAYLGEENLRFGQAVAGWRAGRAPDWCRCVATSLVTSLSAPMSSVRMVTGMPFHCFRYFAVGSELLLLIRHFARFMNRNSVR